MALSDTYQPAQFYFEIQQGAHFYLILGDVFADNETGETFDFTSDPAGAWTAAMNVVTGDGSAVTSFATSGKPGTIILRSDGRVALDMSAANTASLTPTTDVAGQQSGSLIAALVLTDPSTNEPWLFHIGRGRIRKQVTGG